MLVDFIFLNFIVLLLVVSLVWNLLLSLEKFSLTVTWSRKLLSVCSGTINIFLLSVLFSVALQWNTQILLQGVALVKLTPAAELFGEMLGLDQYEMVYPTPSYELEIVKPTTRWL